MEELKTVDIVLLYECLFEEDCIRVNFYDEDLSLVGQRTYFTLDTLENDLQEKLPEMSIEELAEFFDWQKFDDYFLVLEDVCEDVVGSKRLDLVKKMVRQAVKVIEKNGIIYVV